MPKGTRVSRCVDKVKKSKDEGAAIAICQDSTNQGYASGKKLKESLRSLQEKQAAKRVNPGEGDSAKNPASDEYVSGGKTGKTTIQGRLTDLKGRKKSPSADVRVKNYTAGPKKPIPGPKPGLQAESENPVNLHEILGAIAKGIAAGAAVGAGKRLARKSDKQKGKDFQKGKMEAEQEGIEEAVPLVAMAGKAIGSQLLRRGAVVAGRKAAQGSVRRGAAKAARKAAKNPKVVGAMGTAAEKGFEALKAQRASDKDLEENKMNNAYINKLEAMGLIEGVTTGDDAEKTGERIGRAVMKGGDPTKALRIATKVAAREGPDHTKERGKEVSGGMRKAGKYLKSRTHKMQRDHTEYHQIGFVMAEAMGLVEMEYKGASYIPKKRPDLENKPKLDIPDGSKPAPRTPLTKKKPGETTAQAIRRSSREQGTAGKNPRG